MNNAITVPRGVEAIIQFGSTARGDADVYSDLDICAIVKNLGDRRISSMTRCVAKLHGTDEQSVSAYRWSTVRHMAKNGSLFLWHLKREGRVLYERGDVRRILNELRPYRGYSEDLLLLQEVCDDTANEFTESSQLDLFDLHTLFLVVRNVCMLLTVKAGEPSFGRTTVYRVAVRQYGRLPVTARLFDQLTRSHLVYLRDARVRVALPSRREAAAIVARVSDLLRLAWRRLE